MVDFDHCHRVTSAKPKLETVGEEKPTTFTRPQSSQPKSALKKSTRLITSVAAFNPTAFQKVCIKLLSQVTSSSAQQKHYGRRH